MLGPSLSPAISPDGCGSVPGSAILASRLYALAGATLIGLHVFDDATLDGSNNVLTLPGRYGPTATYTGAGSFPTTVANGRRVLNSSGGSITPLSATLSAAIKCVFAVAGASTLPFTTESTVAVVNSLSLNGIGGTSNFQLYVGGSIYIDNVGSANLPSGLHVIDRDLTSETGTTIQIGNLSAVLTRVWLGQIGCVVCLSDIPDTALRTNIYDALRAYYSLS
jgi:hypothetical protein